MPLANALEAIDSQSGTRIVFDPDAVPGKTSAPVEGVRSAEDAVAVALHETGLQFVVEPDGHITVGNHIVVTAQRDEAETSFRVEGAQSSNRSGRTLKELPQGTEVVTSALVRQQQALTLNDALRNAGSVVVGTNLQGTPSFAIRGNVSSTLQNGVVGNANTNSIDTIERIEVLKGPAAILSGSGNLGGIVNVVDKRPSAEPILDTSARYGTFGDKKIVVDASNALNDAKTISGRIIGVQAGSDRSYGGYMGRREEVIAPSLRYKTAASDFVIGMNALDNRSALEDYRIIGPNDDTRFVTTSGRLGPRNQGFWNTVTRYYASAEQRITPWLTLSARLSHTDDGLIAAIYSPAGFVDPATPNILVAFRQSINTQQATNAGDAYARLKFNTGPIRHTVTAGYNDSRLKVRGFNTDPTESTLVFVNLLADNTGLPEPALATIPTYQFVSRQQGMYIQDFIDVGALHLLASVRRTKFRSYGSVADFGFGGSTSDNRATATTPGFGGVFDVTKAISVYANYQQGFEPVFALTCDGAPAPTTKSENIEAGAKADFFGRKLSATAAVYQLKQGNITYSDFSCAVGNRVIVQGGLKTRGVELTLAGEVTTGLSLNASYSFANNNFENPTLDFGTVPSALYRHKYTFYGVYEFQSGALKGLGLGGGVFGNGRSYVDQFGETSLRPQAEFDANLTYRLGRALFNLGVKNIADTKLNAVSANPSYVAYLQPRTVTASMTLRFFK